MADWPKSSIPEPQDYFNVLSTLNIKFNVDELNEANEANEYETLLNKEVECIVTQYLNIEK